MVVTTTTAPQHYADKPRNNNNNRRNNNNNNNNRQQRQPRSSKDGPKRNGGRVIDVGAAKRMIGHDLGIRIPPNGNNDYNYNKKQDRVPRQIEVRHESPVLSRWGDETSSDEEGSY